MAKTPKINDKEMQYLYEINRILEARRTLMQRIGIIVKRFRGHIRTLDKYEADIRSLRADGQLMIEGTNAIDPAPEVAEILNDPNGVT